MLDILIVNGHVYDGTNTPPRDVDIGVLGNKIVFPDRSGQIQSKLRIDASRMAVAPGFIDMHSHVDYTLPVLPTADSMVYQGFTLEVAGNCGSSPAPLDEETRQEMIDSASEGGTNMSWPGTPWDWESFGDYLDHLRGIGISTNVVSLVGHGTIRKLVMGNSRNPPDHEQLGEMANQIRRSIEEGAIGFSTGLGYPPGSISTTEEIIALAKVAVKMGGIYTSHIRSEGDELIESISEAISVGRESGIPVQISHLKALGQSNWFKLEKAIELIQTAIDQGLDVSADKYPYQAMNTNVISLLPVHAQTGGIDRVMALITNPDTRPELLDGVRAPGVASGVDWDSITISYCPKFPEYDGYSLEEIARSEKKTIPDTILDLALETRGQVEIIAALMSSENLAFGLSTPWVMICTDGEGRSVEGLLSRGIPHPRNYGTTAKWLGEFVREKRLVSLQEAIYKMTGLPARKLKLDRRGILKEGNFADITVFDPATIMDLSTYKKPHQYPRGIPWVIVNGEVVIAEGEHTGARPGMVLGN